MTDPEARRRPGQRPLSTSHGSTQPAAVPNGVQFNEEELSEAFNREMATLERYFVENQQAYSNIRQQFRQNATNLRIVSRAGYDQLIALNAHVPTGLRPAKLSRIEGRAAGQGSPIFKYIPPRATATSLKPFRSSSDIKFVVMHSFGDGFDRAYLTRNNVRNVAIDPETGHSPTRWRNGISTLIKPGATGRGGTLLDTSIHHFVSLKGDLVNSVSWDNSSAHGEGGGKGVAVNRYSIGIEHEMWYVKLASRGGLLIQAPFSEEQFTIDAFLIKKLMAYTGLDYRTFLGHGAEALQNIRNKKVGCFNHKDSSSHNDPGAQFFLAPDFLLGVSDIDTHPSTAGDARTRNIWRAFFEEFYGHVPRGTAISAYARIFDKVSRLRSFNLQTEVFDTTLGRGPIEFSNVPVTGTHATAAAGAAVRDRLAGVDRAQQMQGQTRAQLYGNANNSAGVSANVWSRAATQLLSITQIVNQLPVLQDMRTLDFNTGLWTNTTTASRPTNVQPGNRDTETTPNPVNTNPYDT